MESIMKIQKFQTVQSLDYSEMILMITWQNVVPDGYVKWRECTMHVSREEELQSCKLSTGAN